MCDEADNGIQLWYLPFVTDADKPHFRECVKHPHIEEKGYVLLKDVRGLTTDSVVCLEQPKGIDKQRIIKYLGKISKEQMKAVDEAALESFGIALPECVEAP